MTPLEIIGYAAALFFAVIIIAIVVMIVVALYLKMKEEIAKSNKAREDYNKGKR